MGQPLLEEREPFYEMLRRERGGGRGGQKRQERERKMKRAVRERPLSCLRVVQGHTQNEGPSIKPSCPALKLYFPFRNMVMLLTIHISTDANDD